MQNDETIWHCINNGFCSFKVKMKTPPQTFCRNENNVSGLCNRVSCPLANSNYATVKEKEGVLYLHIKTVERAHMPSQMWEVIKLSRNFAEALAQITENLDHWPEHMVNRCKQRLTKLRQVLIRERKAALAPGYKLVAVKNKTERREAVREEKAEKAAHVELAIEQELLARLKAGTYGDIYNFDKKTFDQFLQEGEEEEMDEELESELEDELEDEMADIEDLGSTVAPRGRGRRSIEYEVEEERDREMA